MLDLADSTWSTKRTACKELASHRQASMRALQTQLGAPRGQHARFLPRIARDRCVLSAPKRSIVIIDGECKKQVAATKQAKTLSTLRPTETEWMASQTSCEGLQGGSGQLGAQNLVPGRVEPQEPGVRSSFGSLRPDIHVSKGRRVGVLCSDPPLRYPSFRKTMG